MSVRFRATLPLVLRLHLCVCGGLVIFGRAEIFPLKKKKEKTQKKKKKKKKKTKGKKKKKKNKKKTKNPRASPCVAMGTNTSTSTAPRAKSPSQPPSVFYSEPATAFVVWTHGLHWGGGGRNRRPTLRRSSAAPTFSDKGIMLGRPLNPDRDWLISMKIPVAPAANAHGDPAPRKSRLP